MPRTSRLRFSATSPRAAVLRAWLTGTFAGRALAAGAAIKFVAFVIQLGTGPSSLVTLIDTLGDIALVSSAVALGYRLYVSARRRLLWRVRRRLTLSYIFIGFVPALLIIAFFVVSGLLMLFNVGSYLMRSRIQALADQVGFMAETATVELQRAGSSAEFTSILNRLQASVSSEYPNASYAAVPADRICDDTADAGESRPIPAPIVAGPWAHIDPPAAIPSWLPCAGQQGLLGYVEGVDGAMRLAVRAVALPASRRAGYAVVIDLPVGETLSRQLRSETGVQIGGLTPLEEPEEGVHPVIGRAVGEDAAPATRPVVDIFLGPANVVLGDDSRPTALRWVTPVEFTDWDTGRTGTAVASFQMDPLETYRRIAVTSSNRVSGLDFAQILLLALAIVGGLFLVIQLVAFGMGFALARSITGAVHDLFTGTERVRQGDFTHKIPIHARDQLGELADSFNSMTASIEDLLHEKAEKERLEQELRIARRIQKSLLPQGPLTVPGFAFSAHCEPAREVGGDYYDFLPIDDDRIGILIADVSGKGTSAALYMAELKGIVLTLSQLHTSPRQLLIDANRIIARHLDTKSFITVTYAIVNLRNYTLTHARAGHCPLIYRPGINGTSREPQILAPDGLVLGLQLDDGTLFNELLQESTIPLGPGDLILLYTDGITEAMNAAGDCYGDSRLADLVSEHGDLAPDELREHIVRDVHAFAGAAAQQDDMTLVLLKVEGVAA